MGKVLGTFTNGFTGAVSRSIDNIIVSARAAVKAPDVYGSNEASYSVGDPVDVLVRGSVILQFTAAVVPGSAVYIRKADGALVTEAGTEGTTLALPNETVRTASDSGNRAEVVLLKRNIL